LFVNLGQNRLPPQLMRGTLLNTAAIAVGAIAGMSAGRWIPPAAETVVLDGMGLVVIGIAVRMILQSKNVLVVVAAVAIGGLLGLAMGLNSGLDGLAEWAKVRLGGGGRFTEGLVTTTVLYCVGPMTIMGCLQDGLEGRSELLVVKSMMDGISAVFFAAAMGGGVLVTAVVVLILQGALTLLAHPLRRLADDAEVIQEAGATGGTLLLGIALGLLNIKHVAVANYLPALVLAPMLVALSRRFRRPDTPPAPSE